MALANGLSSAPRQFTKLMKPVYSFLRKFFPLLISVYIDDSLIVGDTYQICADSVYTTWATFCKLGFIPHPDKSQVLPTQVLDFLGYTINTVLMIVTLPHRKIVKFLDLVLFLETFKKISIQLLAKLIGKIVSFFPAATYGRLHYRSLELDKIRALKSSNGKFSAACTLSSDSWLEINWWKMNVHSVTKPTMPAPVDFVLQTDASSFGWGAYCFCCDTTVGGMFSQDEHKYHINTKELLAIHLALLTFRDCYQHKRHLNIQCDNTTAISVCDI